MYFAYKARVRNTKKEIDRPLAFGWVEFKTETQISYRRPLVSCGGALTMSGRNRPRWSGESGLECDPAVMSRGSRRLALPPILSQTVRIERTRHMGRADLSQRA